MPLSSPARIVGRDEELGLLTSGLEAARAGRGSTLVLCGETGIGKTRLLDELAKTAADCKLLRGSCIPESSTPFLPFREALGSGGLQALLSEGPNPRLEGAYLLSAQGLLLGKAERQSSSFDADVFTSMLGAVESFVKDSLSRFSGKATADSLNSMGYGDYTILLQKGELCTLAAIISGQGNEFLVEDLRYTIRRVASEFGARLRDWNGVLDRVRGIERPLEELLRSGKYDGIDFARDDPGLRRSNMLENITRGIMRESGPAPILLMIEDLQWADSSSLALLHYLSRNTRDGRVMIAATYRPEDLLPASDGTEHPLQGFLRTMASESLLARVELKRLGPEAVEEMVRAVLGNFDLPGEFIENIRRETDGNPMYVMELLRLYELEGAIFRQGESWKAREVCATCTPSRINEVVLRRLGRLTKEERDVLDCASVIGLEFSSMVLARALDLNRMRLLKLLKELEDPHRLVRARQELYLFDQTKVKEVLYSQLGPELRKEYHLVVARAIESVHEKDPDSVLEEMARHYFKAGDAERSIPLLARAGERARAKYANQEALECYSRALGLMGDEPRWAGDAAGLWEGSGEVLAVTGQFDRAVEAYRKALAILTCGRLGWGRAAQERSARVLRRISEALEKKGDFESAEHGLESAFQMLAEPGAERGRVMLGKGILRWKLGDYDGAARLVAEALRDLEANREDPKDLSKAHNILGLVLQSRGDYDGSLTEFSKSLEIDTRTGDVRSAITTNNNIGVAYWNKDEYDRAARIFEDNLKLIQKLGDQHALANTYNNLGLIQWNRGRYPDARLWHEKSLAIRERIGDRPGVASCHNNLGLVSWGLGEFDSALEHFQRCLDMRAWLGDRSGTAVCLNNIGNILADRCRYDEALEHYRRSLALMRELGDRQGIAIAYNNLGDITSRLGKLEEAFDHYTKSLGILESIGDVQGVAVAYNNLGNLYIEKGEYEKTLEYFEKSRQIIERIGDEKGLAVALNNLGDLWYYRGDHSRAEEFYQKSAALCERTGHRRVLVENLCGLAEVSLRNGDLDGAAGHAGRAFDISREMGLRENEGWSLRILGRVYGKQGKWNKCMELLDEGVKVYREIGLDAEEGDALLEIGQAYIDKGDPRKAQEFLEKARALFERRGLAAKAERARLSLEKMGSPGPAVERD